MSNASKPLAPQTRLLQRGCSNRENQVAFGPRAKRFKAEGQGVHYYGCRIIEGHWVCVQTLPVVYIHGFEGGRLHYFTPMKVRCTTASVCRHVRWTYLESGARHLYLLDYAGENLQDLRETIESRYPEVKVTTVQADAADEKSIAGLCDRAMKEEGRLDVFFANVGRNCQSCGFSASDTHA